MCDKNKKTGNQSDSNSSNSNNESKYIGLKIDRKGAENNKGLKTGTRPKK
ncbi:hypothetical protein [uncultured Algibacter sp.]|nr:hypothetical protein [uncultured Algibacter sp.]